MSLDSTLRGLAAEIGQSRTVTGSVAAPAKLRHRTGSITAYTQGDLTASVQIGGDIVDAPFLATYNPTVGDAVSVLINNGSPLILGPVNKAPATAGAAVVASGYFSASDTSGFTGADYRIPFDTDAGSTVGAFTLGTTPDWNITVTSDGMYVATAACYVIGADAGDVFRILMQPGSHYLNDVGAYGIADSTGQAFVTISSDIDFMVAGASSFNVSLEQIAGTGIAPVFSAKINITKFAS